MDFSKAIRLVQQGVDNDVFPCASYAIGNKERVFTQGHVGYRTLYPKKLLITPNTLFDVASLTKILVPTMLCLKAIEDGKISLEDKLHYFFANCYDKGELTIKSLLTHTAGIAQTIPLHTFGIDPINVYDTILKSPFERKANSEAVYSCMGFILLGGVLESVYGETLDELAVRLVFEPLEMYNTTYKPMAHDVASTQFSKALNDYCCGIVEDANARFMNGVSGNAGVFTTLNDMVRFCSMLSNGGSGYLSPAMFNVAISNHTKGFIENRGLGFLLTGSKPTFAGDLLSEGSFGHTGFTGCSFVVDKQSGVYVILLTNRIHFGSENDLIVRFRRQFHNCIYSAF